MSRKFVSLCSLMIVLQGVPAIAQTQALMDPIQQVVNAGLMSNYPDGEFHAERVLVRAEIATILVKTFGLQERITAQTNTVRINDVPDNHWAYQEIQIVLKNGIMSLDRYGMFAPDQPVTRAEGLAVFAQAYGVFQWNEREITRVLEPYADANQIPEWARQAIATVISEELVNIDPTTNQIQPLKPMTRGDIAYTLNQYLTKQQNPGTVPSIPLN